MVRPTKAIIGVAGYGSRMLPVSKAVEKCMLPLLNRPVIDYIVQDCIRAGVHDITFVVSPGSTQLQHYYSRDVELEAYLVAKGKSGLLAAVRPPEGVSFHYVEQDMSKYGTTTPLWMLNGRIAESDSFLYIMGDQTLYYADGSSELSRFIEAVSGSGLSAGMVGVEVPYDEVEKYGIIDLDEHHYFRGITEKPRREEATSNLNNACVYLLPGSIMRQVTAQMESPRTEAKEYYFTDVINDFVAAGNYMYVHRSSATYLDCGTLEGWVSANQWLYQQVMMS